jgi:hypothetical protein
VLSLRQFGCSRLLWEYRERSEALPQGDCGVRTKRRAATALPGPEVVSEAHAGEGLPRQDVGPIRGSPGLFRLRCGDWRAIFSVERGTMIVKRVRHRREVCRG